MRTNNYKMYAAALVTGIGLFFAACTNDLYEQKNPEPTPDNGGISQELKDFGFATRGDVQLSVNYDAPGFKAQIEVYTENPLDDSGKKKEGIKPIFITYTDEDSKFEGPMYIPTAAEEIYLYTNRWGLPQCLKLEVTASGAVYDATKEQRSSTKAMTRAFSDYFMGNAAPYGLGTGRTDNLSSLCKWDASGFFYYEGFGNQSDYTSNYVTTIKEIKGGSLGDLASRTQATFDNYAGSKSEFLREADITNIKIKKAGTVDLVYLAERGAYQNTLGYYYYKAGSEPGDLSKIKKYIIFPNILGDRKYDPMRLGQTVRLKYFNEDGTSSETFPEGTIIGWFFISDGFNFIYNSKISEALDYTNRKASPGSVFFSNDKGENRRFVSLVDTKTNIVILGFEDQVTLDPKSEDYSDVLFFVKSEDGELDNAGKPEIDEDGDVNNGSDVSAAYDGTLGFEDIWPSGGDYDLNDVAVEYGRDYKINSSRLVTEVTETFKFVQPAGSANLRSYFAYQVNEPGNYTLPEGVVYEDETRSFIISIAASEAHDKVFVITRKFSNPSFEEGVYKRDFNPYIIVNNDYKVDGRKEVHLPNHKATSKADLSLIGQNNDAFYMDKKAGYPFAIDIPVKNFALSPEKTPIYKTYPNFESWAKSFGKENTDWYK